MRGRRLRRGGRRFGPRVPALLACPSWAPRPARCRPQACPSGPVTRAAETTWLYRATERPARVDPVACPRKVVFSERAAPTTGLCQRKCRSRGRSCPPPALEIAQRPGPARAHVINVDNARQFHIYKGTGPSAPPLLPENMRARASCPRKHARVRPPVSSRPRHPFMPRGPAVSTQNPEAHPPAPRPILPQRRATRAKGPTVLKASKNARGRNAWGLRTITRAGARPPNLEVKLCNRARAAPAPRFDATYDLRVSYRALRPSSSPGLLQGPSRSR